jgi:hypothetical protein
MSPRRAHGFEMLDSIEKFRCAFERQCTQEDFGKENSSFSLDIRAVWTNEKKHTAGKHM